MNCAICTGVMEQKFVANVLSREVRYFLCGTCGFLCTETPFWLEEAYRNPLNASDTGLLTRNVRLARLTAALILLLYDRRGLFVDFAGGYGLLVRILRDWGFDFRWYDKHAQNLFAIGFEHDPAKDQRPAALVTCFEAFEHFVDPKAALDDMLKVSSSVFLSTYLLPPGPPEISQWWYYGPEHGQHVSFFSHKALQLLAESRKLNFYSDRRYLHLFSKRKLPSALVRLLFSTRGFVDVSLVARMIMGSRTRADSLLIKNDK